MGEAARCFSFDVVVLALLEGGDDAREAVVGVRRGLGDARDDQRRAGLVDEDRVDLVHDAEVVAALDAVLEADGHVVAQVVEAELGVGAVGDVGGVRLAPLGLGHHRRDHADRDAEQVVDRLHPLGVAAGQVVVDRHQVHAAPQERVQVDGRHGRERLALAGLHLGDAPLVERHRADQLDVEHAQAQRPDARLAGDGEGLVEDVVELGPVGHPGAELLGLGAELVVAELLHLGLEVVDRAHPAVHPLHRAALAHAEDLVDHVCAHAGVSERGDTEGIIVARATADAGPLAGPAGGHRAPGRGPMRTGAPASPGLAPERPTPPRRPEGALQGGPPRRRRCRRLPEGPARARRRVPAGPQEARCTHLAAMLRGRRPAVLAGAAAPCPDPPTRSWLAYSGTMRP